MAFFTFTTVSGSAATNNLVQSVVAPATTTAATITLVNGIVTYVDNNGNWASTGNALSAYAPGGVPVFVGGANAGAGANAGTSLKAFVTPGFTVALSNASLLSVIDATGATSDNVDSFVANHVGAPLASVINASVNADQFNSLFNVGLLRGNGLGVDALDATGASSTVVNSIVNNITGPGNGNVFQSLSISNLSLTSANFISIAAVAGAVDTLSADAVTIDANAAAAGVGVPGADVVGNLIAGVAANGGKVGTVYNVHFSKANIADPLFAAFVPSVAFQGIIATNAVGFDANDWANLVANRTAFAADSISNAGTVTASTFLSIPNKFATAGVTGMNLATATSAQIDGVAQNVAKIAAGALSNVHATAAQFSELAPVIAPGSATVDAAGATAAQVTTILNYLPAFVGNALTNLTITDAQFNSLGNNGILNLSAATPMGATGALTLTSASAAAGVSVDASLYSKAINVLGSEYGDSYQFDGLTATGAATVQGAKGSDVIIGSSQNDSLSGGNAADTITGGLGNDTITGGNSILANVLTGDGGPAAAVAGNDTFITNGGVNTIMDLGRGTDVIQNSATVSATVSTTARIYHNGAAAGSFLATNLSSNAGGLTITDGFNTGAGAATINLSAMNAAVGVTVIGGANNDLLIGSIQSDSMFGGQGTDSISAGLGNNTITGGAGQDTLTVVSGAFDTITDLHGLGAQGDVLITNAGATVYGTVSSAWQSAAGTTNAGTVTLSLANGVGLDLAISAGANGYTITAAENNVGSAISASLNVDTIVGSSGNDTINGNAGNDKITLGAGVDRVVHTVVADGNDAITGFTASAINGDVFVFGAGASAGANADKIALTTTPTYGGSLSVANTGAVGTVSGLLAANYNEFAGGAAGADFVTGKVNVITGTGYATTALALAANAGVAGEEGFLLFFNTTTNKTELHYTVVGAADTVVANFADITLAGVADFSTANFGVMGV